MARHTVFADIEDPSATRITVTGDQAKHAVRVKRLRPGERVNVLDGRGNIWEAAVAEARRDLVLELGERSELPAVRPHIELCSAAPKGPRLDKMIDQLAQLGVAAWRPLHTKLGVVEPGENKIERMRRIAAETVKQALLPRPMHIDEAVPMDEALSTDAPILVADAMGEPYTPTGAERLRLLVGPEGGFTEDEYAQMSSAGVRLVSLGPTTLRIETAAVAAAAIVLDQERRAHSD
jgi:16S rRNA (uracil1498-N3)-methyltransferase